MSQPTNASTVAMFMSIDVSGSTAFKTEMQGDGDKPAWLEAFEEFFREVPLVMMGQIARAFTMEDDVPVCAVWKVIGDEIVFMAEPRTAREAELLTVAFYRTVISYDRTIFDRWPLRIKGCCWAARISVRNREIEIHEMRGKDESHPYVDYLGPDVDAGFRLSACAGRGQVIVSSNLVELLAAMEGTEGLQFHYVGKRVLKGVYAGRPYPLFLMSMPDLMPETWEWEEDQNTGIQTLAKNEPMPVGEILELLGSIHDYLNRMGHVGIERLQL